MPDFLPGELHVKEDNANVTIHFFLGGELHCMNRPRDETMAKTLKRLSVTIKKKAGKNKTAGKTKKKASDAVVAGSPGTDPSDLVTVHEHGTPIDVDVVLNEAWRSGMSVSVGTEYTFVVVKNAPAVISITVFPKHVLSVGTHPNRNPNPHTNRNPNPYTHTNRSPNRNPNTHTIPTRTLSQLEPYPILHILIYVYIISPLPHISNQPLEAYTVFLINY